MNVISLSIAKENTKTGNMADILYFKEGKICITEIGMEIDEFKNFKRYDTSTNKSFFQYALNYIFYVYQIFEEGDDKSYMSNMPLPARKIDAVKKHCGPHTKVVDFEENKWVKECIDAYKRYTYTQNMYMFDALKEDIFRFTEMVNKIPYTYKVKRVVYKKILDDGPEEPIEIEIEVPYVKERIDTVKKAVELNDLFKKAEKDAKKDVDAKRRTTRLFEDPEYVKTIPLGDIPVAPR